MGACHCECAMYENAENMGVVRCSSTTTEHANECPAHLRHQALVFEFSFGCLKATTDGRGRLEYSTSLAWKSHGA